MFRRSTDNINYYVYLRILSDGSLYTRKLINKPVGSNKFLIPLLAPFGAEFPKYTDVIEESLINPTDHTACK